MVQKRRNTIFAAGTGHFNVLLTKYAACGISIKCVA